MKRKVAFLLAAIMTFMLAPVKVSASTYNNHLVNIQTVGPMSLLYEHGTPGVLYLDTADTPRTKDHPKWYVDGTDLVLPLMDNVTAGFKFRVQLSNAKWFFKHIKELYETPETDDDYDEDPLETDGTPLDLTEAPTTGAASTGPADITDVFTMLANLKKDNDTINDIRNNVNDEALWPSAERHYRVNWTNGKANNTHQTTYDRRRGIFYPQAGKDHAGTYYRFIQPAKITNSDASTLPNAEVPYELVIDDTDNSTATVTILANTLASLTAFGDEVIANGYDASTNTYNSNNTTRWEIRVPLVSLTVDSEVDIGVTVSSGNQSTITSYRTNYAIAMKTDTKSTCPDFAISRDEFNPGDFIITELRPGSIRAAADGTHIIALTLPNGYHWKMVQGLTDTGVPNLRVGVQPGLAWQDGTGRIGYGKPYFYTTPNGQYSYNDGWVRAGNGMTDWPDRIRPFGTDWDYQLAFGWGGMYGNDKYNPYANDYGNFGTDDGTLLIRFNEMRPSQQLTGKIYISGLSFYADDSAAMPTGDQGIDIKARVQGTNVTTEDVKIGERRDWNVFLKTTNAIPTLVSGRYIGPSWNGLDADDNTHKTAHVQMFENTSYSWWGSRTTVLALPQTDNNTVKGAKFRKIRITDTNEVLDEDAYALKDSDYSFPYYGVTAESMGRFDTGIYLNDGVKHGTGSVSVMVNDHTISISNVRPNVNKRATIDFDLWVSVELGFAAQRGGDLKLSIDPSSTSLTGTLTTENMPSVVVAHIVDPIKVTSKVSDLKIGYQYQATADIQIQENGPAYLLRDKTVRVSITDLISSDMYITPSTTVKVTAGDLKIKNINSAASGGFTSQSYSTLAGVTTRNDTSNLSFDIDRQSGTPSTITISNVAVKMDRTIPVTNQAAYQVLVWGTAVAENYGLTTQGGTDENNTIGYGARTWKADFNTAGVSVPYINVISSAPDDSGVLSQEVRVPIGETYFVVNGTSYTMDAAAYISPASHSTMVPIRFVANAFGLRNDNQIVWDDSTKTVTIIAPNRTIQFSAGKSSMVVNGVSITMVSPDNLPVVAEIKGDAGHERMYIPFRALGQAFGIPVDWDTETQTAIYNKGANTNLDLPVANSNPAVTQ